MKPNFKPSAGLYLINVIPITAKTTHGKSDIIIPETVRGKANDFASVEQTFDEWPFQATVVAVGSPVPPMIMSHEIGDLVYLTRELSPRDAVLVEKKVYAFVHESDIIGHTIIDLEQ